MQVGDEKESISFDLRPSDAINMAVRCKVFMFSMNLGWNCYMNIE